MTEIILDFFDSIFKKLLESVGGISQDVFVNYLYIENQINNVTNLLPFETIYNYISGVALGVAILLFLKKGFEIYILWNDGDSDLNPAIFLASFFKMTLVIVWFNRLYKYGTEIAEKILKKVFEAVSSNADGTKFFFELATSLGIFQMIFVIVLLINTFRLIIQFYQRGLELMILRLGIPLIALDLLNSDAVAWRTYIKKIIQVILTLILQLFLYNISLFMGTSLTGLIFAIAIQTLAVNLPHFLSEVLVTSSGNGGLISKATTGVHLANSVKTLLKR